MSERYYLEDEYDVDGVNFFIIYLDSIVKNPSEAEIYEKYAALCKNDFRLRMSMSRWEMSESEYKGFPRMLEHIKSEEEKVQIEIDENMKKIEAVELDERIITLYEKLLLQVKMKGDVQLEKIVASKLDTLKSIVIDTTTDASTVCITKSQESIVMKSKTTNVRSLLLTFGIILVVLQLINFIGVSRMYVGLYPDKDNLRIYIPSTSESELTPKMFFFAIEAGFDRFSSGFEDLFWPKDTYRVSTAKQMASAHFREALGCSSGGSTGLTVYDTTVAISYWFFGINGIILILISEIIKHKNKSCEAVSTLNESENE